MRAIVPAKLTLPSNRGPFSRGWLFRMIEDSREKKDIELERLFPLPGEIPEEYHHKFPSIEIESRMTTSMVNALELRQPEDSSLEYLENRGLGPAEHVADMGEEPGFVSHERTGVVLLQVMPDRFSP